jgi:hypothetical protein
MNRKDYSKDVIETDYMLANEILDYDTLNHNWTGINSTRMRLPDRYDISKYYRRNKTNAERGQWLRKDKLPDFSDDFSWQITYKFPAILHNNISPLGKIYGGKNVTYRRLYLILCERFNNREYFVDTYFDKVYPYTIKEEVDAKLDEIKYDLLSYAEQEFEGARITQQGTFDKRVKANRGMQSRLRSYEKFADEWADNEGIELASLIRRDIIRCLSNGQIPLNNIHTEYTRRRRVQVGYTPDTVFYAMGDLINHIQLFVKIGGNRQWRTSKGLLV